MEMFFLFYSFFFPAFVFCSAGSIEQLSCYINIYDFKMAKRERGGRRKRKENRKMCQKTSNTDKHNTFTTSDQATLNEEKTKTVIAFIAH